MCIRRHEVSSTSQKHTLPAGSCALKAPERIQANGSDSIHLGQLSSIVETLNSKDTTELSLKRSRTEATSCKLLEYA